MINKRTAILLVNTGSPAGPDVKSVRSYLKQFLNDPRVIVMPKLLRSMLVNCIIVPFRSPKSALKYKEIWDGSSFPLIRNSENLVEKLKTKLDASKAVFLAMRYGKPGIEDAIFQIRKENFDEIILLPLFPQYSSATTGSVIESTLNKLKNADYYPILKTVKHFYKEPAFIKVFASRVREYHPEEFEFILFSFHGLPVKQAEAKYPDENIKRLDYNKNNHGNEILNYETSCYETAKLIADELGLAHDKYSVTFQSRFSKNWLSPFTDSILIEKAQSGIKSILIVSPSFVADCLETIHELGLEYSELFIKHGGTRIEYVENLNDSDEWADAVLEIVSQKF